MLLVECDDDVTVPGMVIDNYAAAFAEVRSLTRRKLEADHGLSAKPMQKACMQTLIAWLTEMVVGARGDLARRRVAEHDVAQSRDRKSVV